LSNFEHKMLCQNTHRFVTVTSIQTFRCARKYVNESFTKPLFYHALQIKWEVAYYVRSRKKDMVWLPP
jgi:hypothetical protein